MNMQWAQAALSSVAAGMMVLGAVAAPVGSLKVESLKIGSLKVGSQNDAIAAEPVTRITESQIRQIFDAVLAASKNRNAEGVLKFLAPNARIEAKIDIPGVGLQELSMSREEYGRYLVRGFSVIQRYNGKYSNLKVQISPDARTAVATCSLQEDASLKNLPSISTISNEAMGFEIVQGQVLITLVKSASRFERQ